MRVLVIVGPTAGGKSQLAEHLAQAMPAELVSADASQVYRGLDIGTAKPTAEEQRRSRYHGIDLRSPRRPCTAGTYGRWARRCLRAVSERGRLPVLVGGSGFYVQATVFGLHRLPPGRPQFREGLRRWIDGLGAAGAHAALAALDREWATELAVNDRQRVQRALEVVLRTGRQRRQLQSERRPALAAETYWVGLRWARTALAQRIEARVDAMLQRGWLLEVESLLEAGVPPEAHALQAIGYRQLVSHLQGHASLAEARQQIIDATRRYAKRQMTWFRRWEQVRWWSVQDDAQAADVRQQIVAAVRYWHGC